MQNNIKIVLDTNILYFMADAIVNSSYKYKYDHFISKTGGNLMVLDLVWSEFLSSFLHKKINFKNYEQWYRDRNSIVSNVYMQLKRARTVFVKLTDDTLYVKLFEIAKEILNTPAPKEFIELLIKKLEDKICGINKKQSNTEVIKDQNELRKIQQRWQHELNEGKILDGMDSVILAYAALIGQKYCQNDIYVLSGDEYMVEYTNYIQKIGTNLLPDNLTAISERELMRNFQY